MSNRKKKNIVVLMKACNIINIGIMVLVVLPYLLHCVSNDTAQHNTLAVWIGRLSIIYLLVFTGLKIEVILSTYRDIYKGVK